MPGPAKQLQRQMYALAHQGLSGHRSKEATLRQNVLWGLMEKDVGQWRSQCLHCLKLATGEMVPRPLWTQLIAEHPGEVLMAGYIKMGNSRTS